MKKQNLGLLLGAVWFFGFVAGWSGRGIYEDQKPPQPKPAVSLGEAHKLGWLQGYSATAENEKRGTPGSICALTLQPEFLRDSFATVNEFNKQIEK